MTPLAQRKPSSDVRHEGMRIGGEIVTRDRVIEVYNPFTEKIIATVPKRRSTTSGARFRSRKRTSRNSPASSAPIFSIAPRS